MKQLYKVSFILTVAAFFGVFGWHGFAQAKKSKVEFKFRHETHKKIECSYCHKNRVNGLNSKKSSVKVWTGSTVADSSKTAASKPAALKAVNVEQFSMKSCYSCHAKTKKYLTKCSVCHYSTPDGRIVSNLKDKKRIFPPDWIKGPTHKAGWAGSHAKIAGADSSYCANCHRETFCSDCHTGKRRPRKIHPSDWISIHGNRTGMNNPNCTGCHRTQTFCIDCHRRTGIAPDSPTSKRGPKPGNFHKNATPARICRRARTNITACASCHSESSCIRCHARINPHPAGFSRNCKKIAKHNMRACKKCHSENIKNRCK